MTRHREEYLLAPLSITYDYTKDYVKTRKSDNVVVAENHLSYPRDAGTSSWEFRSMDDVVIPNFRKRSAMGEIFNNAMTKQHLHCDRPSGYLSWDLTRDDGTYFYTDSALYAGIRSNPGAFDWAAHFDIDNIINIAVTQAYSNIDNSKTMLLATLGELDSTVKGLVSILWRAIRIIRAVRRLDLKHLRKEISLKELQDRYMEARYSLRPLVFDVKQTIDAINPEKRIGRQTFRGSCTRSYTGSWTTYLDEPTGSVHWKNDYHAMATVTARAGVLTDISNVSSLSVWGVDHILESMWELIPFSFIVDWFLNIGSWIASWTPEANVNHLASWVTVQKTATTTLHRSAYDLSTYRKNTGWSGTISANSAGTYVEEFKTRTPNPSRPLFPSINVRLDSFKLLDLGIILKNLRKLR